MLQRVAVCCSVLQRVVAVCCSSVLQCVAVCFIVCCSVLQCVEECSDQQDNTQPSHLFISRLVDSLDISRSLFYKRALLKHLCFAKEPHSNRSILQNVLIVDFMYGIFLFSLCVCMSLGIF